MVLGGSCDEEETGKEVKLRGRKEKGLLIVSFCLTLFIIIFGFQSMGEESFSFGVIEFDRSSIMNLKTQISCNIHTIKHTMNYTAEILTLLLKNVEINARINLMLDISGLPKASTRTQVMP